MYDKKLKDRLFAKEEKKKKKVRQKARRQTHRFSTRKHYKFELSEILYPVCETNKPFFHLPSKKCAFE